MKINGLLLLLALCVPGAIAQSGFSVGGQVGNPTGITVRVPARAATSWTGVLAYGVDNYMHVAAHYQYERPLPGSPLNYYFAPGGFVGVKERGNDRDADLQLGAALLAGLNFYTDRIEVYLHLAPGMTVLPSTSPRLGAAVGVRYAL